MKLLAVVLFCVFGVPLTARAEGVLDITFPVDGEVSFSDSYYAPRSGGRIHEATDIMADKMTPVLAATDGEILFAPTTEPSYGYMIMLGGDDGYQYNYVHLNNDTPGTDDGVGGVTYAYAPGVVKGARVTRGQHIAWVGDSGNAEGTAPHLHFEILDPSNAILNPYASLVAAHDRISEIVAVEPTLVLQTESSLTINDNLNIDDGNDDAACTSNTLIRTPSSSAVYYCGRDGGRYVFPDEGTYFSWYENFDAVQTVSDDVMGSIPIRGAVTYRPGTVLLKLPSVPKVYAVDAGGELRWVPTAEIAEALYGANWSALVRDLPESFFPAYTIGDEMRTE